MLVNINPQGISWKAPADILHYLSAVSHFLRVLLLSVLRLSTSPHRQLKLCSKLHVYQNTAFDLNFIPVCNSLCHSLPSFSAATHWQILALPFTLLLWWVFQCSHPCEFCSISGSLLTHGFVQGHGRSLVCTAEAVVSLQTLLSSWWKLCKAISTWWIYEKTPVCNCGSTGIKWSDNLLCTRCLGSTRTSFPQMSAECMTTTDR